MNIRLGPFLFGVEMFKEMTDEQLRKLTLLLKEINFPVNPESRQRDKVLPLVQNRLALPSLQSVDHFIGMVSILIGEADDYEEFLKMVDSGLEDQASEDVRDKIRNLFGSLNFQEYFYYRRLGRYVRRANAFVTDIYYACDLRGRFDKDYSYSEIPIENYEPKLIDVTPIVTLMLELDDGDNQQRVWFQTDSDGLNKIIASLLAAQKELRILNQSTKGENRGNK
jgi:hypothetical protein